MSGKVVYTRYASDYNLGAYIAAGWKRGAPLYNRGGVDCHIVWWPHDKPPPEENLLPCDTEPME